MISECSNACLFCAQAGGSGVHLGEAEITAGLRALRDEGYAELSFTGGEPTLHPGLLGAVRAARALGFRAVGVQTHGRRLRAAGLAADLAAAGATDVHLSLHGLGAAHDHHTGVAGSFTESTAGLVAARTAGLVVGVTSVLTRSNARSLGELGAWLATRAVAAWCVAVPRVAGALRQRFDAVSPRLGVSLPHALHALAAAQRDGLAVFLRGVPACLLGPFAGRVIPEASRAFDVRCAGCVARERCAGVDPVYLRRFAGDELSPGRAPQASPAPFGDRDAALARIFVGEGPLVTDGPAFQE